MARFGGFRTGDGFDWGIETLATHYARLLGTDDYWRVEAVDLRLKDHRVESRLKHVGSGISGPDCGR